MAVSLRLIMFHVYFLRTTCCNNTVKERAVKYDSYTFLPRPRSSDNDVDRIDVDQQDDAKPKATASPKALNGGAQNSLSFDRFRDQIEAIFGITTWQKFFHFVGLRGPKSKDDMAHLLCSCVKNSRRKKYHKTGMDFSRIHSSGTSKLLAKGQEYASKGLKRVVFEDRWGFEGRTKFLDATCILYAGKKRVETVDYQHLEGCDGAVQHSGDMMNHNSGTHTININLESLPSEVTACVFVLSAWQDATLADIRSPAIRFTNADDESSADPLCVYNLDSHDKISHLKSVIMCKLYRSSRTSEWHVLAVGDSQRGCAGNYGPIYKAVQGIL